jgi:predicted RNA binding protein YcfA (HicA-like mRNA interferase family)
VSSNEIIRKLEAAGWILARVKGSHHHYKHSQNPNLVTVPHPRKDMPLGTLRNIQRASGVLLT